MYLGDRIIIFIWAATWILRLFNLAIILSKFKKYNLDFRIHFIHY
jgi:hypothetical protein